MKNIIFSIQLSRAALWIYPACLIFLVFFLLNSTPIQHSVLPDYSFYDIHRIIELLIFGVMGVSLLTSATLSEHFLVTYGKLPRFARAGIPIFFIMGCLSSFYSPIILAKSLLWVAHLAALFFLMIYIASFFQKRPDRTSCLFLIILSLSLGFYVFFEWLTYAVTLYGIHFFPHFASSINTDELIQNLRFPGYSNPRFLDQVLSWLLPLIPLSYCLYDSKKNHFFYKNLIFIISAGLWQMFWMSQSRALYLELFLLACLLPVLFRKQAATSRYLKIQGFAMLTGLLLYLALYHLGYSLPERSFAENTGDHGRWAIWKFSLSLISHHPVLGVGPLNFMHYSASTFNMSHPHQAFLFIMAEWGIPAGIFFIFLILWGLKNFLEFSIKTLKSTNSYCPFDGSNQPNQNQPNQNFSKIGWITLGLSTALCCGLIHSQFSGTLVMPSSQVFLSMVAGWALGLYQVYKPDDAASKKPFIQKIILKIIVLSLFMLILNGIFPEVLHLPQIQEIACEKAIDEAYPSRCPIIPNYWADEAGDEESFKSLSQNS